MEKCKYCQAELSEGSIFCSQCGRPVAEPEEQTVVEETMAEPIAEETLTLAEEESVEEAVSAEEESEAKAGKKATPGKIAMAVMAVVLLAAMLVGLLAVGFVGKNAPETTETTEAGPTVPADGNPNDETCKGTYTVTDEIVAGAKDTVVATVGDKTLTNGQLQIYYWLEVQTFLSNYGYYAAYFGLDYTQPLDTQINPETGMTWQQYFLQCALKNWHLTQCLAIEAENAGMEISAEDKETLANLETSLAEMAATYNVTLDELMRSNFGAGTGVAEYRAFQELYLLGGPYYNETVKLFVPTDEELEAFYAEHEADYTNSNVSKEDLFVDVRHILIGVEGGTVGEDGVTTYSEEEWAACEAEAQAVLDEWLAGDKTEGSFAALANEKSEDGGSNTNGGLYENVYLGQMVAPFEEWCFDETRQYGDYGLVKTDFGYHIMYFVGSHPQWKYYAESDWVTEQTNNFTSGLMENNPIEVSYKDIVLGYINLAGE